MEEDVLIDLGPEHSLSRIFLYNFYLWFT